MTAESIEELITLDHEEILSQWLGQLDGLSGRTSVVENLKDDCESILNLLARAARSDVLLERGAQAWARLSEELDIVARAWQERGLDWDGVASIFFSLRTCIVDRVFQHGRDDRRSQMVARINQVLDHMMRQALEGHLRARDRIIERQQQEVLELSVPVSKLWPQVLVLPLVGSIDSHRAQVVLETLLLRIGEESAKVVIIDIMGVVTVDTAVAHNIIKTMTAARLMGAECIVTGIRPQIAQTIVHLGIELDDFRTKATLAEGVQLALHMTGSTIARLES